LTSEKTQKKFVIIDGNSLLYRAFYALPPLQNRRGEQTNAVYGFTNMLVRLLSEENPDYVAVAFDPPRPSFRVRIDESYKAQREKMPRELGEQIARTREILSALRIPVFEVEDYEADDVIGTLADRFNASGREVTVVSGDADLLQLVGEGIDVLLTKKGISQMERYDRNQLKEEYGLTPEQFIEFKALKGDPSDNIPGVPGIGDKTARRLLEEYGTLDHIYKNMDHLKGKVANNLAEYRDQLYTGLDLVTLRRNVPVEVDWDQCRRHEFDYQRLLPLLEELEFRSLAERLAPQVGEDKKTAKPAAKARRIEDPDEVDCLLEDVGKGDQLVLLVELEEGRPYWRQPVRCLALAAGPEKVCYIDPARVADEKKLWKRLAAIADSRVGLLVHNAKICEHLFSEQGLKTPPVVFDTYLAAYLVDPARGGYDLPVLMQRYLGSDRPLPGGRKKEKPSVEESGSALACMAGEMFSLREKLNAELSAQDLEKLIYDLELPLAGVLARMERRGMNVDLDYLHDLSAEICRRLDQLEVQIYAEAGEEFNLNSPQQLSTILFDKLGLPTVRKTKTGRSTDARVLEELASRHEIASLLLHYRQLAKLEGTYLSGLIDLVDPEEEKIFTTFNQAATATGRLSSSDPNLQNIPIRLEEGRRIRRAFVASKDKRILFSADYSQVELRILAHLSADPILVEAFTTGEDIHRRTAAEVNGVPLEKVTPMMREKAKAVNFGIIYGSSDYGLAQGLKIPRAEAKAYIDSYFERYQGVRVYMNQIIDEAREKGYVTTLFNRRRYLPEIKSDNHNTRSFAERTALNTPIQGSAADIIKLAMIKIDEIIEEGGFRAAMLLQIHDELLFEIGEDELDFFAPVIKREMENAFSLDVPLQVDLKWGHSWDELEKM